MGNLYVNKKHNFKPAFTVVELLMVVFVIGILVGLSVIGYNGFRQKANDTTLLSDLDSATSILEHDLSANGEYPTAPELADGGKGLPTDSGTTYQYSINNSSVPPYFCLTGTNGSNSRYIDSNLSSPAKGACPGHVGAAYINPAKNVLGELGNNTNFTPLIFDGIDFPSGSRGSLVSLNGNYPRYQSTDTIPVDSVKSYDDTRLSKTAYISGVTTSRWYIGLSS